MHRIQTVSHPDSVFVNLLLDFGSVVYLPRRLTKLKLCLHSPSIHLSDEETITVNSLIAKPDYLYYKGLLEAQMCMNTMDKDTQVSFKLHIVLP